jgi:Tfp pilus assembly protein PilF
MSSPASAQAKQHVNSGMHYMGQKQYVSALQEFDNAIQLDPNDAQAFYWRGLAHLEMRSYAQAENDFNVASWLAPEYAAPLDALAFIFE